MQMFKIRGFNSSSEFAGISDHLYWKDDHKINKYIFFDLQEELHGPKANEMLEEKYFDAMVDIQFTVLSDVDKKDHYEYVRAYAEIDKNAGFGVTNSGKTGWFAVKSVSIGDKKNGGKQVNPISRAIWNFARLNTPKLVYPYSEGDQVPNPIGVMKGLLAIKQDIKKMIVGFNRSLYQEGYGQQVVTSKSWIRLNAPTGFKLGGGHRVKKIVMSDNWEEMGTANREAETSKYGQEYIYTTEVENADGTKTEMSSGVASYEPSIGNEENPLHQPLITHVENKMAPDEQYMVDEPYGESFFPGAGVGYSKVRVANLKRDHVTKTATGYSVSEFFTAKDFPVKVIKSEPKPRKINPEPFWSIFSIKRESKLAVSQGYVIELNDMHGKPKSQYTFSETENLISGASYEYQVHPDNDERLTNTVLSVNQKGDIKEMDMGVNMDFYTDSRVQKSETWSAGAGVNLDAVILLGPWTIPSIYPSYSKDIRQFNSLVSTKVVNRSGILKKTIAYKEGSSISTENMLYDSETGAVLLTSTQNEFNDNIYSQVYPAHWAYDEGMGSAHKNIGLTLNNVTPGDDTIYLPNGLKPRDYLVPGDECILSTNGVIETAQRVWVYEGGNSKKLNLISQEGIPIVDMNGSYSLKVIRSGRKNIPNTPIGSVTALKNPLIENNGDYNLEYDQVISTAAVEYSDKWQTVYGNYPLMQCDSLPTDYYNELKTLLSTLTQDSNIFRKYYYSYYYPIGHSNFPIDEGQSKDANGFMRDVADVKAEYKPLITSNACLYERKGKEFYLDHFIQYQETTYPTQIEAQNDCSPEGTVGQDANGDWYCHKPIHYVLSIADQELNYLKRKTVNGYEDYYPEGADRVLYCNDTLYLHDTLSTYIPVTFEDLMHCIESEEMQGERYISTVNYARIDSLFESIDYTGCIQKKVRMVGPETILPAGNEYMPDKYRMRFTCTDSTDYMKSCEVDIDCRGKDFHNILEFLEFDSVSEYSFSARVKYLDQCYQEDTTWISITSNCKPFKVCKFNCIEEFQAGVINPYRAGLRGNWRKKKDYTYVGERKYDQGSVNTRKDGQFKTYEPFWSFNESSGKFDPNFASKNWIWASEVTKYSPYGNEIENRDALNRYSAAVYSYNHTLPIAVASNAEYGQIAYDGFETQDYLFDNELCNLEHWSFNGGLSAERDGNISHSGLFSLKVNAGKHKGLKSTVDLNVPVYEDISKNREYIRHAADDIGQFKPDTGDYLFCAWVKDSVSVYDTSFIQPQVVLKFYTSITAYDSVILKSSGSIIEGWQRIEEKFTIPTGTIALEVELVASANHCSWFDDVRIHPLKAMMKTYAYHPKNLRLMAEMDENNFATFYEYDLEGALIHVKKETIKGISTLRETRNSFKKK